MNHMLGHRRAMPRETGFSLVEIMVAMVLGLILLGGTIAIYAGSKDSYRLQENVAGLQENARFAIHALRRNIEVAGFPKVLGVTPFDPDRTLDGGNNASDQFTVRYIAAPGVNRDCLGTVVADGNVVSNRYFIDADSEELRCQGVAGTQALVENISNMQALYGIDEDGDGSANRYVTATEVSDGVVVAGTPDWDRVVSLRLALLVASETGIGGDQQANGFTLLDAPAIDPGDARLYRVFTTTIPLRNRIP